MAAQVPKSLQEGVFFKFLKLAELNKLTTEERKRYDADWLSYNDYVGTIAYAKMEGEIKKSIIIAQKLMQEKISIEIISKTTGLPIEEIEKL
ncbi:hypothetical protein [Pedobacter gandavensis]|uniref:hypothetical protein n=1 Tax=Pedobacter gandavensis TaxID=2679963 RepID=UPI00292FF2CD|nr:hypothetical protein [Pedobacter gandavensis]